MNTTSLLNRARKQFETTRTQAAADEKAARLARQSAQAAKIKLKQARKLAKLAKKSARKAEDKADESHESLERVQAKLEKLEKQARKEQRARKSKEPSRKARRPRPRRQPASRPASGKDGSVSRQNADVVSHRGDQPETSPGGNHPQPVSAAETQAEPRTGSGEDSNAATQSSSPNEPASPDGNPSGF